MVNEVSLGLADLEADLPLLEDAFALGPIVVRRYLATGWMNRNWQVAAGDGFYVLRRILAIPASTARSILAVMSALNNQAVPVCLPVRSATGETVVTVNERCYCLTPWIEGVHRPGNDLSMPGVMSLGRLVGAIHQALAGLPADFDPPSAPEGSDAKVASADDAIHLITRIDRIIGGLCAPERHDLMARTLLRRRLELLGEHSHLRPETLAPAGSFGRVHGDLNPRNLLFRGEDVVAVLDWDRMCVSPYAREVVRAGIAFFGSASGIQDLARVSAFTAAYRTVLPLDEAALADAVSRLWWKRITDVWPAEFRYVRSDRSERIARMFVLDERAIQWWTRHLDDVTAAFAS